MKYRELVFSAFSESLFTANQSEILVNSELMGGGGGGGGGGSLVALLFLFLIAKTLSHILYT